MNTPLNRAAAAARAFRPFRPSSSLLLQHTPTFTRAFAATAAAAKKHSKRRLQHMLRNVPEYPYPIKHTFKQSWFGLYGGKHIQFGNNVPESNYTTRRRWLPNVRHRTVFSRALNQYFSLDITTNVLRTIDKAGGLDAYLTGPKAARIKSLGPTGWRLRWRVMNSPRYQKQLAEEREALGLPPLAMPQRGALDPEEEEAGMLALGSDVEGIDKDEYEAMMRDQEQQPKPMEKTAAQLMIERIERQRGLRKDVEA
ncbi:50S ribosomal protein L24 [Morchella snyderi]|nr:50S ribosomal protein L24 [Morchella snyderi]